MKGSIFVALIFAGFAAAALAQRTDKIFLQGNAAGTQTVQQEAGGRA